MPRLPLDLRLHLMQQEMPQPYPTIGQATIIRCLITSPVHLYLLIWESPLPCSGVLKHLRTILPIQTLHWWQVWQVPTTSMQALILPMQNYRASPAPPIVAHSVLLIGRTDGQNSNLWIKRIKNSCLGRYRFIGPEDLRDAGLLIFTLWKIEY